MYFKHKYEANNELGDYDFSHFRGNKLVGFAQNGPGAECADLLINGLVPAVRTGEETQSSATMEIQTYNVIGIDAKDQLDLSAATYASQYRKSVVTKNLAGLISVYPHVVPEHTYGRATSQAMKEQVRLLS